MGPMAAADPFKSNRVLLEATICAGSSLSLTCDTDQGIQGQGESAEQRCEDQEYGMRHLGKRDDAAGDDCGERANAGDHRAPIHAIRQPADGVLCQHGGENAHSHEGGYA